MRKYFYIFFLLHFLSACTNSPENKFTIEYAPFSSAHILLLVEGEASDTITAQAFVNTVIPRSGVRSAEVLISSQGNFNLDLEIDRPSKGLLKIGDSEHNIMLLPNDTIKVILSLEEQRIAFKRLGQSLNNYYHQKKKWFGYTDIREPLNNLVSSTSTFNKIKKGVDSVVVAEFDFLKSYEKIDELPSWFRDYEISEILYAGAGFKTTKPDYNLRRKVFNDEVPENYYDFLDSLKIDNHAAILSANFIWFLDVYFAHDLEVSELRKLSDLDASMKYQEHLLSKSRQKLSGKLRDVYDQRNFVEMAKYFGDITEIDSLAEVYQIEKYEHLLDLSGTKIRERISPMQIQEGDSVPDFAFSDSDLDSKAISEYAEKDLIIKFWATWCRPCLEDMPEYQALAKSIKSVQNLEVISICINSNYGDWEKACNRFQLDKSSFYADSKMSNQIRNILNINGVPHYTRLGKGNILFMNDIQGLQQIQKQVDLY